MHQDEGHYTGKHPGGAAVDERVSAIIGNYSADGRISCSGAHAAAAKAGVSPAAAGQTLDLMEIRISGCQLGLFGHGKEGRGKVKPEKPGNTDGIEKEIKKLTKDNGISCYNLWLSSEKSGCTKLEAAGVCESLGIKIKDCQLGAF